MKYSDLLIYRDAGELRVMLDALSVYWNNIPKVERPGGNVGRMIDDALSYRRKINKITAQEASIIWKVVNYALKSIAEIDPKEIDKENSVIRSSSTFWEDGNYWVFPKHDLFVNCENLSHFDFLIANQELFIEKLGIDGFTMMRERHSMGTGIMRLALASGAIRCNIKRKGEDNIFNYQCCQVSLIWLKRKIGKMPTSRKNIVRVYDPAKEYDGWHSGIKFIIGK